jgi:hypothetical protein
MTIKGQKKYWKNSLTQGMTKNYQEIFAENGYEGKWEQWVKGMLGLKMEVVKRNETGKWEVLPKRWIV